MNVARSLWTDPPAALDVTAEYVFAASNGSSGGGADGDATCTHLLDLVTAQYAQTCSDRSLVVFDHGPATFLFDNATGRRSERTVLVVSRPLRPSKARDRAYQAGYPLPQPIDGRPVDRGHFLPYSGGGLFGPNMFVQDRALNRGWSRQGRLYRSLEARAVTSADASFVVRPHYVDDSDVPVRLDLGVIDARGWEVYRFRNRYDIPLGDDEDELEVVLNGAVNAQIGALGEETTAAFLVQTADATIVAMGSASMPRNGPLQDLDLLAILDGTLVAFEVKTRFMAEATGRRTRDGNLARPRRRRAADAVGPRQGSQDYVRSRPGRVIDVGTDYTGIAVRVVAIDFRLMQIQQFELNDSGTGLAPIDGPDDCTEAARAALAAIQLHRGRL